LGFRSVAVLSCVQVVHGLLSAVQAACKRVNVLYKIVLGAEKGGMPGKVVAQSLTFVAQS
jgi:hypothetical protein